MLDNDKQLILAKVLEYRPALSRKQTPALQALSFYSSELKALKQVADLLNNVRSGKPLMEHQVSRARYFNTLRNQGLVKGTPDSPTLTGSATDVLKYFDIPLTDEEWREKGPEIETLILRPLVEDLRDGKQVDPVVKNVFYNAQTFFDLVPKAETIEVINDLDRLLLLFYINSVGWEIGRYFRLLPSERTNFEDVFNEILKSDFKASTDAIEVAAADYKKAASGYQRDVRFRIRGFLHAYNSLRTELGTNFPRLDCELSSRKATAISTFTFNQSTRPLKDLPLARQLIISGCPGSGKSFYLDQVLHDQSPRSFRTQFHQETMFSDFVGSFKPQPLYDLTDSDTTVFLQADGSTWTRGRPAIDYQFVPGPLIKALICAYQNPSDNVVLVIEELNRGNAGAIFGDFLQLLDRDNHGASRYSILPSQELRSYLIGQGWLGDEIRFPGNLYLWATMNTADQGVFPIDTAFRRRWSYIYKGHREKCLYSEEHSKVFYAGDSVKWDEFRKTINNELISLGVHEDKLVGPYFLTEAQLSSPTEILNKLFLYLWDDVLRFRQDAIFKPKSFSEVEEEWNNGLGSPLSIVINHIQSEDPSV